MTVLGVNDENVECICLSQTRGRLLPSPQDLLLKAPLGSRCVPVTLPSLEHLLPKAPLVLQGVNNEDVECPTLPERNKR